MSRTRTALEYQLQLGFNAGVKGPAKAGTLTSLALPVSLNNICWNRRQNLGVS